MNHYAIEAVQPGDSRHLADLAARLAEHVPSRRRLCVHRCATGAWPVHAGIGAGLIDDYLLLFVDRGAMAYAAAGERFACRSGGVLLVGSGVRVIPEYDPAAPPSVIAVHFGLYEGSAALGDRLEPRRRQLAHSAQVVVHRRAMAARRRALFARLAAAHHEGCDGEASSLLHLILCSLAIAGGNAGAIAVDDRIERVRAQLELHPVQRRSVDELAQMAGLSRNYFVRLFTAHCGSSPKAYQLAARMRFAHLLLERPGSSVGAVARALLYPDAFAFSKQFRLHHGHPPSQVCKRT